MATSLLLPAAGRAVRLGGVLKELLPLGYRNSAAEPGSVPAPVIGWPLATGVIAGAQRAVVVTSSAKAPMLMEAISSLKLPIPISYVHQPEPDGLGSAVSTSAPYFGRNDTILVLLADTILWPPKAAKDAVGAVNQSGGISVILSRCEKPEQFGTAVLDQKGRLVRIEDKPQMSRSPWVWTGIAFRPEFFSYLQKSFTTVDRISNALNAANDDGLVQVLLREETSYWDVGTYEGYVSALTAFRKRSFRDGFSSKRTSCRPKQPRGTIL